MLFLRPQSCVPGHPDTLPVPPKVPVAAATARVSATTAFQHCAKNNIQVHGGMGFTWDFDCHLYYRRANALALALGSLSTWESLLIERMSAGNREAAA